MRHHVQPVVQVLAEGALFERRAQIALVAAITRTSMCARLVAAQPLELALLQHPQQLHLNRRRHVADLVEEHRARVGLLELAGLGRRSRR